MGNSSDWFKDGLRFKCTECGKCCTGSPGYVWVTEEDIQRMANELNMPIHAFMKKYLRFKEGRYALIEEVSKSYDCVFLKDNKCQIYRARPKQCRTFPWWVQNLESKEAWQEASKECEGIHKDAPLHSYHDILKVLKS
jgi:uncharacterized protein